jgi:site-specific recombinase XerD
LKSPCSWRFGFPEHKPQKELNVEVHDAGMLTDISPRHIDHYKAERLKMKSPVTVNVELRSLRTILNYAVRWRLIETNSFARVQLVRIPEMPPLYFTKEEFRLLLSGLASKHCSSNQAVLGKMATLNHSTER